LKATKIIGLVVLIGAGLIAIFYFLNKKVSAAETAIGTKLEGLAGGVVGTLGAGVKALAGGLAAKTAIGAGSAAGTATAATVGTAAVSGGMATSGPIFGGMSTVGIAGVVSGVALWLYGMGRAIGLFGRKEELDPYTLNKLNLAIAAGTVRRAVSKVQLKAPEKR